MLGFDHGLVVRCFLKLTLSDHVLLADAVVVPGDKLDLVLLSHTNRHLFLHEDIIYVCLVYYVLRLETGLGDVDVLISSVRVLGLVRFETY